jgi:hypothetical protein
MYETICSHEGCANGRGNVVKNRSCIGPNENRRGATFNAGRMVLHVGIGGINGLRRVGYSGDDGPFLTSVPSLGGFHIGKDTAMSDAVFEIRSGD